MPAAEPSPELLDSVSPPLDVHERERIERYLKRPFQTPLSSEGNYARTDFSHLLALFASFARDFTEIRTDVLCARYIKTASGNALDEIGRLAQLQRFTNESDDHYRVRLQAQFRRIVGSCTVDDVREAAALLLDVPIESVQFSEPFGETVAAIRLHVQEGTIADSPVTAQEFVELVGGFSAAGVDIAITAEGEFMTISLNELRAGVNYPDRGYGEAGYTGRIEY